jgi:hypothetical protein
MGLPRVHSQKYVVPDSRLISMVASLITKRSIFEGKDPEELLGNPQFHQQNVYAIAMRVLGRFEFALGRRVSWKFRTHQLKIVPHAFREANAFLKDGALHLLLPIQRKGSGKIASERTAGSRQCLGEIHEHVTKHPHLVSAFWLAESAATVHVIEASPRMW